MTACIEGTHPLTKEPQGEDLGQDSEHGSELVVIVYATLSEMIHQNSKNSITTYKLTRIPAAAKASKSSLVTSQAGFAPSQ